MNTNYDKASRINIAMQYAKLSKLFTVKELMLYLQLSQCLTQLEHGMKKI